MNLDIEHHPFVNKAQIFDITIDSFIKEFDLSIPYDLWKQYFNQFKWLSYKNGILHCWICQEAYGKFPDDIECDEWTVPSELSYKSLDKNNLILILKIHNFDNNHIHASELLNQVYENDEGSAMTNSSCFEQSVESPSLTSSHNFVSLTLKRDAINMNSENMELLRSFDMRHFEKISNKNIFPDYVIDLVNDNNVSDMWEPPQGLYTPLSFNNIQATYFNPWGRYLTRYSWLYLKDDNPGCKYCEQAFKLSLQMSYTKWTCSNMLTEAVSQDRPNRTLLQHDRSKNHRIAEDVLVEHNIITPRLCPQPKVEDMKLIQSEEDPLAISTSNIQSEHPSGFSVERWERFTKDYPWLYYGNELFHCTYCEKAFELHRNRMTPTSWTSPQFDSARIKDICKARHYFYDHQRSNNHRIARNILQMGGFVSTKSSIADEDEFIEKMSISDDETRIFDSPIELMRPLSPYDGSLDKILNEKQWQQLCLKYSWLGGTMGESYGCSACLQGRKTNPLTVNISRWTQGWLEFTKTKYIQLRKSLWCHSISRNHINAMAAVQQPLLSINGHHSKHEAISLINHTSDLVNQSNH